ncbi:MAG: hypothetical protein DMG33_04845 [Acidobacteria bacterium]|nr:MAG: hypothetical protein DMG33_04845 [Acidobacteriota bacterium]
MSCRIQNRAALAVLLLFTAAGAARAQQVADRIAARVENDIVLLSEVRELGAYQMLMNGKKESDSRLLDRLIDQWIVRTEADASHFPPPSDDDVERELEKTRSALGPPERFAARLRESGLQDADLLDSRFRPAVQISPQAIEDYYQKTVVPYAQAHGETPPSLDAARDSIREALIQRGIDEQADRWLKESRVRLHIEKRIE